jgi:hypothetical protein
VRQPVLIPQHAVVFDAVALAPLAQFAHQTPTLHVPRRLAQQIFKGVAHVAFVQGLLLFGFLQRAVVILDGG